MLDEGLAGVLAGAGAGLQDDRRADLVGRGHDRLHLLEVVDVEGGDAVAVLGGVVEQLAHGDERHGGSWSDGGWTWNSRRAGAADGPGCDGSAVFRDENAGMRIGLLLRLAGPRRLGAGGRQASGDYLRSRRTIVQDALRGTAPPPPPPPKPPCALDAEQRKRAIRQENQFLTRYPDEAAHRRAQLADLKPVVERDSAPATSATTSWRRNASPSTRKPRSTRTSRCRRGSRPSSTRATPSSRRLTKILRGHERKIGEIQARYQCQRDTFGKLWTGAAPGSSACDRPACARPEGAPARGQELAGDDGATADGKMSVGLLTAARRKTP